MLLHTPTHLSVYFESEDQFDSTVEDFQQFVLTRLNARIASGQTEPLTKEQLKELAADASKKQACGLGLLTIIVSPRLSSTLLDKSVPGAFISPIYAELENCYKGPNPLYSSTDNTVKNLLEISTVVSVGEAMAMITYASGVILGDLDEATYRSLISARIIRTGPETIKDTWTGLEVSDSMFDLLRNNVGFPESTTIEENMVVQLLTPSRETELLNIATNKQYVVAKYDKTIQCIILKDDFTESWLPKSLFKVV
jgi:hypothetical protein